MSSEAPLPDRGAMEHRDNAVGALAELLLLHRTQIDEAVAAVEETTPFEAILDAFESSVQSFATKEPLFWELRVGEFINDALKQQISDARDEKAAPRENTNGCEENFALEATVREHAVVGVSKAIQEAAAKLRGVIQETLAYGNSDEGSNAEQILERVWGEVTSTATSKDEAQNQDNERGDDASEAVGDNEDVEILTFDDEFLEDAQTTDSVPTAENIPDIIERMTTTNAVNRASALKELMQVPVFEALHCTARFPDMVCAVVGLFLDEESNGFDVARTAMQFVYHLVGECEDPFQFLDIYWAVTEFIGESLSNDRLFTSKYAAQTTTDAAYISLGDNFRVLLLLLERVPLHWIHYPPETLAKIMISTFRLLTLYSKCDMEVEVAHIRPLSVLASLTAKPSWFKTWAAKTPSRVQFFLALNESGFFADLLQTLSSIQPLIETGNTSVRDIDCLSSRYLLAIASVVLEYASGRTLAQQWRRLLLHEEVAARVVTFKSCRHLELTPVRAENDRLFRLDPAQPLPISPECNENGEEREHSLYNTVGNIVLTIFSLVLLDDAPLPSNESTCFADWKNFILSSVSRYVVHTDYQLVPSLLKLLQRSIAIESIQECSQSPMDYRTRSYFAWYPLRDSKSIVEACELIQNRIYVSSVTPGKTRIYKCCLDFILALLSSHSFVESLATATSDVQEPTFCLWKRCVEGFVKDHLDFGEHQNDTQFSTLIRCIPIMLILVPSFKMEPTANSIVGMHSSSHSDTESFMQVLVHFASFGSGFRVLNAVTTSDIWIAHIVDSVLSRTMTFGEVVNYFTWSADFVQAFLASERTFELMFNAITTLREAGELSMAISSSNDETTALIRKKVEIFSLVRAALSSPHAFGAVYGPFTGGKTNSLLEFIRKVFVRHDNWCTSSCDTEDECCLSLQLMLPLLSAIPSKLHSFGLLEDLDLLGKTSDSHKPESGVGACTYLHQKLVYELEHIGGPTERAHWYHICDLDNESLIRHAAMITAESVQTAVERTTGSVNNNCWQAKDTLLRTMTRSSADSELLSQQSWTLIAELEIAIYNCEQTPPTAAVTSALGGSLLALLSSSHNGLQLKIEDTVVASRANSQAQMSLPPVPQRKMLNKMYKGYSQALSLCTSPTTLHAIIRHYGSDSLSCFPMTILMILSDTCKNGDDEVLSALRKYFDCPLSPYMWPRATPDDIQPSLGLTEAVEWILVREYPSVLHAIRISQSSVGALVTRWHAQSFWNYFDWSNIAIYMYLTTLYGVDFQVYILVVVLVHLEPEIQRIGSKRSPQSLEAYLELLELPIDFMFLPWKDELARLRTKYRAKTLSTLLSGIR